MCEVHPRRSGLSAWCHFPKSQSNAFFAGRDFTDILRASRASRLHTFRDSATSFTNAQTGNLKLAQKLLGHVTIDMTAEVYTHFR